MDRFPLFLHRGAFINWPKPPLEGLVSLTKCATPFLLTGIPHAGCDKALIVLSYKVKMATLKAFLHSLPIFHCSPLREEETENKM